jgi:hypothetical protein
MYTRHQSPQNPTTFGLPLLLLPPLPWRTWREGSGEAHARNEPWEHLSWSHRAVCADAAGARGVRTKARERREDTDEDEEEKEDDTASAAAGGGGSQEEWSAGTMSLVSTANKYSSDEHVRLLGALRCRGPCWTCLPTRSPDTRNTSQLSCMPSRLSSPHAPLAGLPCGAPGPASARGLPGGGRGGKPLQKPPLRCSTARTAVSRLQYHIFSPAPVAPALFVAHLPPGLTCRR